MSKETDITDRTLPDSGVLTVHRVYEFEFQKTDDDSDQTKIVDSDLLLEKQNDNDDKSKKQGILNATLTSFENEDKMGDVIKAGALDDWMKNVKEVPMLWSHLRSEVIGKWTDFKIMNNKLYAKGTLYKKIKRAEEAVTLIELNAVKGVSIGFDAGPDDYVIVPPNPKKGKVGYSYEFRKINIREASLVLDPANTKAKVISLKNEDGSLNIRCIERLLISNGLTRSEASDFVKPHLNDDMSDSVIKKDPDMSDSVEPKRGEEIRKQINNFLSKH